MSIKRVLKIESDVIVDAPVKIPFEFTDKSSVPEGKELGDNIVITPITTRTWFKLKPLLLQIEKEDMGTLTGKKDNPFRREIADVMAKYDELLFDIVCIGIHNKKSDPPKWYREALKDNTTWEDLYVLLSAILYRLLYNPFFDTITLLRSVSPLDEAEIIALQKNSKTWEDR